LLLSEESIRWSAVCPYLVEQKEDDIPKMGHDKR
jgi:hypothetical protein